MKQLKNSWKIIGGYLVSVAVFGVVIGVFLQGILSMSDRMAREGAETLRSAVARASVQCYAIEGRYPPSVAYLEENYGVKIDRERFDVFYEGFASNIMPSITVNSRVREE